MPCSQLRRKRKHLKERDFDVQMYVHVHLSGYGQVQGDVFPCDAAKKNHRRVKKERRSENNIVKKQTGEARQQRERRERTGHESEARTEKGEMEDHADCFITATMGMKFFVSQIIVFLHIVNWRFSPGCNGLEYPNSSHGLPRDNTEGESSTNLTLN